MLTKHCIQLHTPSSWAIGQSHGRPNRLTASFGAKLTPHRLGATKPKVNDSRCLTPAKVTASENMSTALGRPVTPRTSAGRCSKTPPEKFGLAGKRLLLTSPRYCHFHRAPSRPRVEAAKMPGKKLPIIQKKSILSTPILFWPAFIEPQFSARFCNAKICYFPATQTEINEI